MKALDITIGRPIANTQIYILDEKLKPVPIGIPGEICIAGEGVGMGYLNRPELTKERFIQNPFATDENRHGKVLYRSGDLGRWRVDGEIEILGRIDTQVKIRGLRIEPDEIESVMSSFGGILHTAVTAQKDADGRQYLIGYYTADGEIEEHALRDHLAVKLPKYMIPNHFVRLDSMPMTPSGKTDRKNLPVPDFTESTHTYIEPETNTEEGLAEIWQSLLKVRQVGREDDFFELGGDSLLAITMTSEISDVFHKTVTVKDIFENTSLRKLAAIIDAIEKERAVGLKSTGVNKYELLPQQKAIYAACEKGGNSLAYNVPARLRLPETVDRDRLRRAITEIVSRHKNLNTFIIEEGNSFYGVYDETASLRFEEYSENNEASFVRPFDLGKAPLVHAGFTKDALLFDVHHIVSDGTTLTILLQEIAERYADEQGSEKDEALWYGDYAEYYKSVSFDEHKDFFKNQLRCDFVPTELPEAETGNEGGVSVYYVIPEELFSESKEFAKTQGLSDTMVFLGAFGILLSKYTGKKDVLSSVIFQNRGLADILPMPGMFVNTIPVYLRAEGALRDYYIKVKQAFLDMYRFQEIPFLEIADAVGMTDRTVINTAFVYQGDGEKTVKLDGHEIVPEYIETNTCKFDLTMELTPLKNGCRIRMEYNCAKYDKPFIDKLVKSYLSILEQIRTPEIHIRDVSVLSKSEWNTVIEEFNDTYVDIPMDKCVHELFMEQVQRTPDKTALVFEDKAFTFKELDHMSNAVAKKIQKCEGGFERNEVIPIVSKRDWRMLVAMLGILKAGGAYLHISPDYPIDRIYTMIQTAGSKTILHYRYKEWNELKSKLRGEKSIRHMIDLREVDYETRETIECRNKPQDLCYVVFTSGSTGTPKGTSITHLNVVNFCRQRRRRRSWFYAGSVVSVTNAIFDIFVTETLFSLLNGMTIYMANEEECVSQRKLAELVKENRIEMIQTTPTKMRGFIMDKGNLDYLRGLKRIVLGGEALPPDLFQEICGLTDAMIFNIYGPAETTVWSSVKEMKREPVLAHE